MYKKFISLTLAVMMIVSVFMISTSAVDVGNIGFNVETDGAVGAAVNDIVTVKVYYEMNPADIATVKLAAATTVIAYNGTYLEYVAGSRTFGDSYSFLKPDSQVNTGIWGTISAGVAANPNDSAKGYTNAVLIAAAYSLGVPEGSAGFYVDPDCPLFTIQFKVIKAIDQELNIGIPESTYAKQTAPKKRVGTSNVAYTTGQIDSTNCITQSSYVTRNFATATKIRRNAGNSALVDLGFTGSFLNAGIPIAFTGGRSTNVTAVGVELTINGVTNTYEDNFVYLNANSNGYLFRVALTGIPDTEYDTPIKARMFVTYNGVDYWSDYVYTTAGAHVDRLP
ncbi:MAG: hypothetical protein BWY46_00985 [Firmicutes bacterium ADurb.Bin300]|nr:MAG: hypothetical protein BWY46_00985 [Firmicutes bacterium ADurb.Bin300]